MLSGEYKKHVLVVMEVAKTTSFILSELTLYGMDCDYCESSFESQDEYVKHLSNDHVKSKLSRVDKMKVEQTETDDDGGFGSVVWIVGTLFVSSFIVGLVLFIAFGNPLADNTVDGTPEPRAVGSQHYHGPIDVTILGSTVDFSKPQYQLQADAFHFEGGDGSRWHVHAERVTFGWAMESLGITITENSVTYEGTTYNDSSTQYSVTVAINGESVDPSSYVLQRGDNIQILVEEQ